MSVDPRTPNLAALTTRLLLAGVPAVTHGSTHVQFDMHVQGRVTGPPAALLWVTPRTGYCDRGAWLWHADTRDPAVFCVDGQDGFPRYFFSGEAMVGEIVAWMRFRGILQ